MIVSVDREMLENATKTVATVTEVANANGVVHFRVKDSSTIEVSSTNKGLGAAICVSCKVENEDKKKGFAINPVDFLSAIAGRKNLVLAIKSGSVKIKADRYKTELVTTSAEREAVLPKKILKKDGYKIPKALVQFIQENLSDITLEPIIEKFGQIPVAVKLSSKGATIICWDNWHMAYARTKDITGEMLFSLPVTSLGILAKDFKGQGYKLVVTSSSLYAYNDDFQLALTLPQREAQNVTEPEEALKLAKTMVSEKGVHVAFAVSDLQALSENLNAVYKKGEHVHFEIAKNSCKVSIKSVKGRIDSDVRCKAKKEVSFSVGFRLLTDVLKKVAGKKVEMTVLPEMLFFKRGNKVFMTGLITGDERSE